MRRFIAVMLAAVMLASLSACAGITDPNAGIYECAELTADGISLSPEEALGGDKNRIELKADGSGVWIMDGEKYPVMWRLDGDILTVMQNGDEYTGTLSEGVITVEYDGITYLFLRADAAARMAETAEKLENEQVDETEDHFWNGEWYGWWVIEDGKGSYEQQRFSWWDCCAEIELESSGKGSITVWDELDDRQSPLAEVDVEMCEGSSDAGLLMSTGGYFRDSELGIGQWVLEPGEYSELNEPLIIIDGSYIDSDNSDNSFTYYIYLRPWGARWDDVEQYDPFQLPRCYYDWYIPLIEAGETAPDVIGTAAASDVQETAVSQG